MAEVIRMPRMSDTMEEGNLIGWLVSEGDTVEAGDTLAEVETELVTHPAVEAHQALDRDLDGHALSLDLAHDLAVQGLPDRGHADEAGDRGLLEGARDQLGGAVLDVGHRGAGGHRHE